MASFSISALFSSNEPLSVPAFPVPAPGLPLPPSSTASSTKYPPCRRLSQVLSLTCPRTIGISKFWQSQIPCNVPRDFDQHWYSLWSYLHAADAPFVGKTVSETRTILVQASLPERAKGPVLISISLSRQCNQHSHPRYPDEQLAHSPILLSALESLS